MSEKKWKITMPNLRKWAEGRTFRMWIITDTGKMWASVDFVKYIQLTDDGKTVEFDTGNGDYCDILRECLEQLALEGYATDYEFGIDYFTLEEYEKRLAEGEVW